LVKAATLKVAPQAPTADISIVTSQLAPEPVKTTEVIGDSIAGAFDALPGFENTTAAKGISIEDTRKAGDGNLKSLIQSIVSTIEPALSALGSQNHAAVSVVIKDSEEIAPELQSTIVAAVTKAS
jgi:hypothetical protein